MKVFDGKIGFGFSNNSDGNLDFRFDDEKAVNKRRTRFLNREDIDPKSSVVMIAEHKNNILKVTEKDKGKGVISVESQYVCEGLITCQKALNLILSVADCIALVLYDKQNKILAMIHVGSKNLAMNTAKEAIEKMKDMTGTDDVDIYATTGPFIKKCCYSFDKIPEHLKVLEDYFISSFHHPERKSRDPLKINRERDFSVSHFMKSVEMTPSYYLDTESALRDQLIANGIKKENIFISKLCSKHDGFPSHRRSLEEGLPESRMLVYARMA